MFDTSKKIIDHRERNVYLYRSGNLWWPPAREHDVPATVWRQVQDSIEARADAEGINSHWGAHPRRTLWFFTVVTVVLFSVLLLAVLLVNAFSYRLLFLGAYGLIFPIILWIQYVLIRNRGYFTSDPRAVVPSLLERGLCAQCGYSLRDATEEPDGCTVCPECGAAWRLPTSP